MQKLIPIVNGLLDACSQTGMTLDLNLPQIAVVGCQSAGKSSVLENFVGRDFLPRGSGVVTRRPLILQLINNPGEWGEFLHCKEKKHTNFESIRKEIEAETNRTTGANGISADPINLRIYSPHVLDITMVDLPGLTKVAIGDQPPDIERIIREMILQFISKETCLILAVTPANTDLANSDALKIAREVDPAGTRTIGVITKIDLMDEGTDALDILENRIFPLRRGYVGVVNRSQKDINGKKNINDALKAERDFFTTHSDYRRVADRCGTPHLQKILNQQLSEHIYKMVPALKQDLQKKRAELEEEVQKFKGFSVEEYGVESMMITVVKKLADNFKSEMGNFGSDQVEQVNVSSGVKIYSIFHEKLPTLISQIHYDVDEIKARLNISIQNIHGINTNLFTPHAAFVAVAKTQIEKLREPIAVCINLVLDELLIAIRLCTKHIIHQKLRDHIENYIFAHIEKNRASYKQNILSLIEIELAYLNTNHENFQKTLRSQQKRVLDNECAEEDQKEHDPHVTPSRPAPAPPARSLVNGVTDETLKKEQSRGHKKKPLRNINIDDTVRDIFHKVESYMKIVKQTACDMVPKAITYYVINKLDNYITHDILLSLIKKPDEFKVLLELEPIEKQTYDRAVKMQNACTEALKAIQQFDASKRETVPVEKDRFE